jgi:hypothetical protein
MSSYAIQGLVYYIANPSLWLISLCPFLMTIAVALISVISLFDAGLHPQAYSLEKAGLPASWARSVAILLVLVEISLITIIYSQTCTPCFRDTIFKKVLRNRGHGDLLANTNGQFQSCRRCKKIGCFRASIISLRIATLPLNLIPILGTIIYIWTNGALSSWELHLPYFSMKGFDYGQQKQIVADNKWSYSSFGMQVAFLSLIPGFGFIFLFTNSVGAALFASDLEDEFKKVHHPTAALCSHPWFNPFAATK